MLHHVPKKLALWQSIATVVGACSGPLLWIAMKPAHGQPGNVLMVLPGCFGFLVGATLPKPIAVPLLLACTLGIVASWLNYTLGGKASHNLLGLEFVFVVVMVGGPAFLGLFLAARARRLLP